MQISDFLEQTGGAQSLARELGLSTSQVQSGAAALLPSILGGFSRQAAAQPTGAAGLGSLLEQMGGGGLLDNVLSPQPTDVSRGNSVLGEIFGGKDVKAFGKQMVTDHTGVNKSATDLAAKLKLKPEDNPTAQSLKKGGADNVAHLKTLKGAAFDKAYVDHEVEYHQAVIDAMDKTLIPNAQNAELKALLVKVRPAFVAHLDHAKKLQSSLGKSAAAAPHAHTAS